MLASDAVLFFFKPLLCCLLYAAFMLLSCCLFHAADFLMLLIFLCAADLPVAEEGAACQRRQRGPERNNHRKQPQVSVVCMRWRTGAEKTVQSHWYATLF